MDATTIGTSLATGFSAFLAAMQWSRANKSEKKLEDAHRRVEVVAKEARGASADDLVKMNADLSSAYKTQAEEAMRLYKQMHDELERYREATHQKQKEDNALSLRLQLENAELRAKTDMTQINHFMEEQGLCSTKISEALVKLTVAVDLIIERLLPEPPKEPKA